MSDMLATIIPKSDQLNADDLIGRIVTITVTRVEISPGAEQPVALYFEGDGGKPYKPGKSMRRVLVQVWGADAKAYIGRSMTLYRDETVKFGGLEVGGIRISHMSHMDKPVTMALTATRANRKPFTVKPLAVQAPVMAVDTAALIERATDAADLGMASYQSFWGALSKAEQKALLPEHERMKKIAKDVDEQASAEEPVSE